jgi:phenylacetate-CoA ligase|tara:strand:- start:848 stop:2272 length:1425 start_codon:yes stop_codon:yes gene_type:complete
MIYFKQISWLHQNLSYPLLKLWGSSPKLVDFTRRIAFGSYDYRKWYKLLKKMENWPIEKIHEFQYEKLKKILEHAYKNVPFYKELWDKHKVKPSDVKSLKDLEKLPIITKDDILKNYSKIFAINKNYKNNMYRDSSGTSGKPIKFYHDEESIGANWAGDKYFKEIIGYEMGKDVVLHIPVVNEQMYLLPESHIIFNNYYPVTKQVSFKPDIMGDNVFEGYLKYIKKFNIKHIEGFPSSHFAFVKYLKKKKKKIRIKSILSHSEVLYDSQKKFIEKYFGCKVFNRYASSECTIRAYKCHEHKGMHISPQGIAEVKGKGFEGKGELVMTSLVNYLFPLIRYSIKDIVTITQKKCSCGRTYPRIMNVEGRSNDFVMFPNGKSISPSLLFFSIVYIKGIKDIYFLQHKNYSLDILVVKEKNISQDKIIKELKNLLNNSSNGEINKLKMKIIFKDKIERKNRKFTVVESKVKSILNELK